MPSFDYVGLHKLNPNCPDCFDGYTCTFHREMDVQPRWVERSELRKALVNLIEASDEMARAASSGPMVFDVRTAMDALDKLKNTALRGHQLLNMDMAG